MIGLRSWVQLMRAGWIGADVTVVPVEVGGRLGRAPPLLLQPITATSASDAATMAVSGRGIGVTVGSTFEMSELAIEVHGLTMRFGAVEAVRGIDLAVATGEVFGFLGPSGACKTTTIEILEGYRARSGGEVSVPGVDLVSSVGPLGAVMLSFRIFVAARRFQWSPQGVGAGA